MRSIESQIQIACVTWFKLQYAQYAKNFFSVPNGGFRNKITGAILKKEGALSGVADLQLAVPNRFYHGLFIEMKQPKGTQQDTQKEFQKAVESQGYKYVICRSLDEFMEIINNYLKDI